MFMISNTFYLASKAPWSGVDILAIVCCVTGIYGELKSDQQLTQFKHQHPGQVCDTGVWRYSRHSNLFFEWLIWCEFGLFGVSAHFGWLALAAPVITYLFMTVRTIPITENGSVAAKGELYQAYQKSTPIFFPWRGIKAFVRGS
jgi:steroid 5-alpha reductase family enzyme